MELSLTQNRSDPRHPDKGSSNYVNIKYFTQSPCQLTRNKNFFHQKENPVPSEKQKYDE